MSNFQSQNFHPSLISLSMGREIFRQINRHLKSMQDRPMDEFFLHKDYFQSDYELLRIHSGSIGKAG